MAVDAMGLSKFLEKLKRDSQEAGNMLKEAEKNKERLQKQMNLITENLAREIHQVEELAKSETRLAELANFVVNASQQHAAEMKKISSLREERKTLLTAADIPTLRLTDQELNQYTQHKEGDLTMPELVNELLTATTNLDESLDNERPPTPGQGIQNIIERNTCTFRGR